MRHVQLFYLLLIGFLMGCTPQVSTPTAEMILPTATILTTEQTKTATADAESTLVATPTPEPVVTATWTLSPTITATPVVVATPTVVQTDLVPSQMICDQAPAYINVREEMNDMAYSFMDYFFEDENKITFLTWSRRPDFNSYMFEMHYTRVQLKELTWDFKGNALTERSVTDQLPLQTPYLEDYYPLEVVGISPNNEWQLLQITDAPEEYQGFWLVNQETVTQIIPYVPFSTDWQWSGDSDMLWLVHPLYDISGDSYAGQSVVVDLAGPDAPQTVFNSWDTDMSPNLLWVFGISWG